MNTENSTDQEFNENALRSLFGPEKERSDLPGPTMGKSDTEFLSGVQAGIARRTRKQRILAMLPALVFTCILAFIILPNVALILDAFQLSLPEDVSMLLSDLGSNMEFKLGIVLLFGLGVPWLIDVIEQTA